MIADRWRRLPARMRRVLVVDAVLAALVLIWGVLSAVPSGDAGDPGAGIDVVVAVAAALPLVLRRVRPVGATLAQAAVGVVAVALHAAFGALILPALLTIYAATAYARRWIGALAVLATVVGASVWSVAANASADRPLRLDDHLAVPGFAAVLAAAVWLAGALRRARLREVEQLRERARLLEVEAAQEARLATLAERSRIAREMHDVLGHSMSVMIAQADGGSLVAERDPRRAAVILAGIADVGRGSLTDIRGLLGLLRAEDGAGEPATDPDPARPPHPGADDVPDLVERTGREGTPVQLSVTGTPGELSAGAGLTAYRAVQEGLTNVVKHAGLGATAQVTLDWGERELRVAVVDDGGGAPAGVPSGGLGLMGMRERAALHGGRVESGPRPGGGFAVTLWVPYRDDDDADRATGSARSTWPTRRR